MTVYRQEIECETCPHLKSYKADPVGEAEAFADACTPQMCERAGLLNDKNMGLWSLFVKFIRLQRNGLESVVSAELSRVPQSVLWAFVAFREAYLPAKAEADRQLAAEKNPLAHDALEADWESDEE